MAASASAAAAFTSASTPTSASPSAAASASAANDDERDSDVEEARRLQQRLDGPDGFDDSASEGEEQDARQEEHKRIASQTRRNRPRMLIDTVQQEFTRHCSYQDFATRELATQVIISNMQTPSVEPKVIMLSGPPSTGKTTCSRIFATLANSPTLTAVADATFDDAYDRNVQHSYYKRLNFYAVGSTSSQAVALDIVAFYRQLVAARAHLDLPAAAKQADAARVLLSSDPKHMLANMALLRKRPSATVAPAASPGSAAVRQRTAVLVLDDFDRIGGRASGGAASSAKRSRSTMMWSFLAEFFSTGVITYKNKSGRLEQVPLPPGWRLVIFMVDNVSTQLLGAGARTELQAPGAMALMRSGIQKLVCAQVFQNDTGLTSRIQKSVVIPFLDYTQPQLDDILRRRFVEHAAAYKKNIAYHVYYDKSFIQAQIDDITGSKDKLGSKVRSERKVDDSTELNSKIRLIAHRNVRDPTDRALAEGIPAGKGTDYWDNKSLLLRATRLTRSDTIKYELLHIGNHEVRSGRKTL